MKILYISHLHPPKDQPLESVGGMQNVSIQLLTALKRRSDVEVESIIQHTSWKMIGLKTFFFLFTLLWKLPALEKKFKPDVILFSSMVTAGVLPFLLNRLKTPCVTINHGQDVTLPFPVYQWYISKIFSKLQGVISVSSATREASIDRGMDPDIGVVLPNGFDAGSMGDLPSKEEGRVVLENKFGINLEKSKLLLTVGRQVKRKGHQWFIKEVMERISSDVVYLVIGDGPEHQNIHNARNLSSLKQKIVLAGKQPNKILNAAYAAADLFVMPNIPVEGDMEGFGIVLLEANRAGAPAVAADLEGIRDVILQGVNGYRVEHSNAVEFAARIDEVLTGDLEKLSNSAVEYVRETFSWNSVVERYITFLKKVNE